MNNAISFVSGTLLLVLCAKDPSLIPYCLAGISTGLAVGWFVRRKR